MLDLTHMIITFSSWFLGLLHMNQLFFCHGYNRIQILEIDHIVGFVVNYLHLVPLVYPGGFFLSKALVGWILEIYFRRKEL